MDFQLASAVVSADGADLGKVDLIIFDPRSADVKSIIVKKGVFFTRDVDIPIEHVRLAMPSRVELNLTREEVDKLPDFVESAYTWPHEGWQAPYGWPGGHVMWSTSEYSLYDSSPYGYGAPAPRVPDAVLEDEARQARENAVVGQRSDVVAKGGEKLGEVHNMLIDPSSHKPSSLVVRSGLILTHDVEIPGDWVETYDDRVVTLNVDKPTVEHLAETQQRN